MPKNTTYLIENKKPFETVQELKNEYKTPSFEEFMETYEFDERIVESYEEEAKAQAYQGPKCGPGKSNFKQICENAKRKFQSYGKDVTGKISCDSDPHDYGKNYAGAIIYAIDGEYKWENKAGDAKGRNGWSFYVIIKSTSDWPSGAIGSYGAQVHGYLIYKALGLDLSNSSDEYKITGAGFAREDGVFKVSSVSLNGSNSREGTSDGDGYLRGKEKELVEYCWDQYIYYGPDKKFPIPYYKLP
jgi:hypothetical protein